MFFVSSRLVPRNGTKIFGKTGYYTALVGLSRPGLSFFGKTGMFFVGSRLVPRCTERSWVAVGSSGNGRVRDLPCEANNKWVKYLYENVESVRRFGRVHLTPFDFPTRT
jgi:hypothetical protein